jgi:acyl-CoA reductase-like NAD-dependent aldehyde dehydrogenase
LQTSNLNFIAGDWVAGSSEIENRNPSDLSDLIGMFAQATPDQLDATLDQARRAQVEWEAYGIERKYNVLMAIGTEMMTRAEELGTLLAREEGKPMAEGKGEVYRAGQFFT